MKSQSFKLFFVLIVSLLIFACKDNSVTPLEEVSTSATIADYAVMDGADIVTDLSDATTTTDHKWGDNVPSKPGDKFRKHRHKRLIVGRILKDLELTDEQKEQVKTIFDQHKEVAMAIHESFKSQVQDILDSAKTKREEIKLKVDAGDITKEEARELIKQLNEETRTQIEATEAFLTAQAELCILKKQLLDDVASVLTGDQLTKYNEWRDTLEDDCLNS